jgi:hypothetical protein
VNDVVAQPLVPRHVEEQLLAQLVGQPPLRTEHERLLTRIPEPWHGRLTARRYRRWRHASRGIAAHNARLPKDAPVLNFYPMRPQPKAPVTTMLARLGARIGLIPRHDQPTIAWDGDTWFSRRAAQRLPPSAINGRCLDISKTVVDRAWHAVSGRSLAVDPATVSGPVVMKPEDNGRHGGRIVDAAAARPRRGWVVQRLVDCREGDWIKQTRAVVIGRQMVIAYEKWRRFPHRFYGTRLSLPRRPAELYTAAEVELVLEFARRIGMDYGEIDILRDPLDGEIYVVDANRTPSAPHELPAEYFETAYGPMTDAFGELIGL